MAFASTAAGPGAGVHWLEQVHGREVATVRGAFGATAGSAGSGDALVCRDLGQALGVLVADCAPIALASPEGVFAAVHAGWRGLLAGVVDAAAAAMRAFGATEVEGALGPCIHPCCYEFGSRDLDELRAAFGPRVAGWTAKGAPALDLPLTVAAALARAGVRAVPGVDGCTGCGGAWFSHRTRGDVARQALVVWRSNGSGRP